MTASEKTFHRIINELPKGIEGKMFRAKSIKLDNGKTAAFFWKENMTFKLDKERQLEALKLDGSRIASHLYATEKLMNGWIMIPEKHSDKWLRFAKKAIDYVENI